MEEMPIGILIATIGFCLGLVFGGTAQRTNFCTMGAISDIVFMEDSKSISLVDAHNTHMDKKVGMLQ